MYQMSLFNHEHLYCTLLWGQSQWNTHGKFDILFYVEMSKIMQND